jgi:hypothetical protein
VLNSNVTPSSQGSGARDTTGGDGPHDLAVGAAHDGGVSAPESDPSTDATTISGAPMGIELAVEASSSHMQMGAATTSPNDNNVEIEVIMGRPCFHGPELISLPKALDMTHAALS